MVRNSPCSVCFLTLKPFRPGGKDLFVVCLVSMGWSLWSGFYSKEDFLVALTLCSRPIFRALFQTYGTWAVKKSVKITWSFSVFSQRRP